jgi:hypothetical protein
MSQHEEHDDDATSEGTVDPIQHFWGTTIKPESEYTVSLERSGAWPAVGRGVESGAPRARARAPRVLQEERARDARFRRTTETVCAPLSASPPHTPLRLRPLTHLRPLAELHLTNALLVAGGAATVYVSTSRLKEPVAVVSLGGGAKHALLDLEVFPDDEAATFRVEGTGTVALSGSIAIFGGEMVVDSEDEEEGGEGEEEADRSALDAAAKKSAKATAAAASKKGAAVAAAVEGSDEEDEEDDEDDDEFDEDEEGESDELDSDDDAVKDEEDDEEDDEEEEADEQAALASALQKLNAAKRKREAEGAAKPAAKPAAAPAAAQPAKKPAAAEQQPAAKKAKTEAPAPAPAAAKPAAVAAAAKPAAAAPAAAAAKPAAAPSASVSKSEIATADTGLQKLADGMVQYRDVRVGSGATPAKGKKVTVSCE